MTSHETTIDREIAPSHREALMESRSMNDTSSNFPDPAPWSDVPAWPVLLPMPEPLPMPDADELRMLRAIVVEAIDAARRAGHHTEKFHDWRVRVEIRLYGLNQWAVLTIDYHDQLWQHSTWRVNRPHIDPPERYADRVP
jgi:hypothetical protein